MGQRRVTSTDRDHVIHSDLLTHLTRDPWPADPLSSLVRTETPCAVVGVLIAAVLTLAGQSRLTQAWARTDRRTRHKHNASSGPQTGRQKVAVVCCIVSRHRTWLILFVSPTCPVVADFARHHHINCLFHHSGSQPSVDAHFSSSATHCHLTSNHRSRSLPVFRQRLKTFLFRLSFPNIVLWLYCAFVDFVIVLVF